MEVVPALLSLLLLFGAPAAVVGGITAVIVRSAAKGRGLAPAEAGRKAVKGFWIAFVVTIALEILLFGLCIAAFSNAYGAP
jgi:hypothetical protein